jgi:diadenosine tetraphosphate (Ap4A) HIT family hydrolase
MVSIDHAPRGAAEHNGPRRVPTMATVFTRIIRGELPGTFVWRDERCVAFLSINPMGYGHTLVVPRDEIDEWTDLDADLAAHLFRVAHVIGQAQKDAFECERIGLIVAGYEVPHCHVHVIPTVSIGQFSFANAAASVDRDDLETAASAIRQALHALGFSQEAG